MSLPYTSTYLNGILKQTGKKRTKWCITLPTSSQCKAREHKAGWCGQEGRQVDKEIES